MNDALKLVDGFPADQYAVDAYRSSSRRVTGGEPSRCQNPTIAEAVDTGIFCPFLQQLMSKLIKQRVVELGNRGLAQNGQIKESWNWT